MDNQYGMQSITWNDFYKPVKTMFTNEAKANADNNSHETNKYTASEVIASRDAENRITKSYSTLR